MKKLFVLSLFISIAFSAYAQFNRFVYFRYDQSAKNNWALIQRINRTFENADEGVLFFEDRIYQGESLDSLLMSPHFLATTSIYNPDLEKQMLNEYFQKTFGEHVQFHGSSLQISGDMDGDWSLTFILSESTSLDEIAQFIDVNELIPRKVDLHFFVYDQDGTVRARSYESLCENQIKKNIIYNKNEEKNEN